MADLELRRKALEASGWTDECPDDPKRGCESYICRSDGMGRFRHKNTLPAVESDPGVSEPWFLEWCGKRGYWARMTMTSKRVGIMLEVPYKGMAAGHYICDVEGATPSEARAKAVIEAARKRT